MPTGTSTAATDGEPRRRTGGAAAGGGGGTPGTMYRDGICPAAADWTLSLFLLASARYPGNLKYLPLASPRDSTESCNAHCQSKSAANHS